MVEAGASKRCTAHNPPVVGENAGDDFWVRICISQDSLKLMFKTVCLVVFQIRWGYFFIEVVNPYNPTLSVRSIDGIHQNVRIHRQVAPQLTVSRRGRRKFREIDGAVLGKTEA